MLKKVTILALLLAATCFGQSHTQYKLHQDHMTNAEEILNIPAWNGWLFGWGASVPSAASVAVPGMLFCDDGVWYVNEGTAASPDFNLIQVGDVSLADNEATTLGTGSDVALKWNGTYLQGGSSTMWSNAPSPADVRYNLIAHTYFDDFDRYDPTATVGGWTIIEDAGGTQTIDGQNGVYTIVTDGDDNDETYVESMIASFKFADDATTTYKLWFEARVKVTEGNTDEANVIVGLSTVSAADTVTNGDALVGTYDGCFFHKANGGAVWKFEAHNAAAESANTDVGAYADATWYTLGFYYDGTATTGNITPYVNGVADTAVTITNAGLDPMHIVVGAKNGGANAETLAVDYVKVVQIR